MSKNLRLNARIDAGMRQELQALAAHLGLDNQTAVIRLAVRRLYQQEIETMNAKQNSLTIFAINTIPYRGAEPYFKFAFTAYDQADANGKAFGWARHHGLGRNDYTVTVATEDQAKILHDEWIP